MLCACAWRGFCPGHARKFFFDDWSEREKPRFARQRKKNQRAGMTFSLINANFFWVFFGKARGAFFGKELQKGSRGYAAAW